MVMTHYMELLSSFSNLMIFMAIPVVLAETLAITEFYVLYTNDQAGPVRSLNRVVGVVLGAYFVGVFIYLMITAVVPITQMHHWRGWIDMLAVGAYLAGVVPLAGVALLELGLIFPDRTLRQKLAIHATFIALFLVVGHVAMIAGMVDPRLGGWSPPASETGAPVSPAGAHQH